MTLANLALAHKNLGQRTEALEAIEQALDLTRQFNDPRLQGHCLAQRGAIHDDVGDWAAALEDYQQASRLLDIAHDDLNRAILTGHRALLLKQQGQYAEAERLLLEALASLEKRQKTPHEKAVLWLNLADLYLAMQRYEQSWRYAQQAHESFARLKSGWTVQAQELLDTLSSISTEETVPPNNDVPVAPLEPDDGITLRGQEDVPSTYQYLDRSERSLTSEDEAPDLSDDADPSGSL
jgi:tetratricopeptide (TPR) repeat protein